jgi:hypothetical protein
MNELTRHLAPTFLVAAVFLTGAAYAMEIQQFDRMADQDQGAYVVLLVQDAKKVLHDEGRADLASKVDYLFTTKDPGDAHSIGVEEFELNLAQARTDDADGVLETPKLRHLEVEEVMYETLKKNGIVLPPSFLSMGKDFKPKFPLKNEKN